MTSVGLWGTFDVDNFGDRLFPVIATSELRRRLPNVSTRVFSPIGVMPTRFGGVGAIEPFGEWAPARQAELASSLDAVVVGGGEIIHMNDAMLAPVYGVAAADMTRINPSGFFIEGLGALERSCPTLWNAVGVPTDPTPEQARRLRASLETRAYVSVRDDCSARRIAATGLEREVAVVPDSAFLLDRIVSTTARAAALDRLRRLGQVPADAPFVVVQGCDLLVPFAGEIALAVRDALTARTDLEVVLVETGPCRGDGLFADAIEARLGRTYRVEAGGDGIANVAAVIAASGGLVASSLHASIAAVVFGRPFTIVNIAQESKLRAFGDLIGRPAAVVATVDELSKNLRDGAPAVPAPAVKMLQDRVDCHFDAMAAIIGAAGAEGTRPWRAGSKPRRVARFGRDLAPSGRFWRARPDGSTRRSRGGQSSQPVRTPREP